MKEIWIAAAVVLVLAALAGIYWNGPDRPAPATPAPTPARVAAEGKVEAMPGFDVNIGTGQLNSKVTRILVKEGDAVSASQLVAELENEDLRAAVTAGERELASAQSKLREVESGSRKEEILQSAAALEGALAAADEARNQHQRFSELRRQGMVAQSALDERERVLKVAEARARELDQQKKLLEAGPKSETVRFYRDQVSLARAGLEHSRKLLDKTRVRSPIAGVVVKRYLDEGEGVTPEIAILAVADMHKLWINAEVDETDVGRIAVGDPAVFSSDAYPGREFRGRVREIANYAGQRSVTPNNPAVNLGLKVVSVKIEPLESTPLRLGMTVNVKIAPRRQR